LPDPGQRRSSSLTVGETSIVEQIGQVSYELRGCSKSKSLAALYLDGEPYRLKKPGHGECPTSLNVHASQVYGCYGFTFRTASYSLSLVMPDFSVTVSNAKSGSKWAHEFLEVLEIGIIQQALREMLGPDEQSLSVMG
jgi:hypothetical protein